MFQYIPDEALTLEAPGWVIDAYVTGPERGKRNLTIMMNWAVAHRRTNLMFYMARDRWDDKSGNTVGDFLRCFLRYERGDRDLDATLAALTCASWAWSSGGSILSLVREQLLQRKQCADALPDGMLSVQEWNRAFFQITEEQLAQMSQPASMLLPGFAFAVKSSWSYYVTADTKERTAELASGFTTEDWLLLWSMCVNSPEQLVTAMEAVATR